MDGGGGEWAMNDNLRYRTITIELFSGIFAIDTRQLYSNAAGDENQTTSQELMSEEIVLKLL